MYVCIESICMYNVYVCIVLLGPNNALREVNKGCFYFALLFEYYAKEDKKKWNYINKIDIHLCMYDANQCQFQCGDFCCCCLICVY